MTGERYELLYSDDFATDPFSRTPWKSGWIDDPVCRAELLAGEHNIWTAYDGGPSTAHIDNSWWLAKNITHSPGVMRLGSSWDPQANAAQRYPGQVGRLTTSGFSASRFSHEVKYGRWDAVWRMDTSAEVMYAIMLYGDSGAYWPLYVEMDIAEGNGDGINGSFYSTLHYEPTDDDSGHGKKQLTDEVAVEGTMAVWHRLSVDFSPGRLDYFLNGKRVVSAVAAGAAGVPESGDCSQLMRTGSLPDNICYVPDEAIPDSLTYRGRDLGPRTFIFQTEAAADAGPNTPTPTAEIDWVAIYRMME